MLQSEPNQALSRLQRGLHITAVVVTVLLIAGSAALLLGPLGYDTADTAGRLDSLRALVRNEGQLRADHLRLEHEFAPGQASRGGARKENSRRTS